MPEKFEDILDKLVLFTARPSSVQRETIFGGHFMCNPYYPMKYLLNMPISVTDAEWYYDKESSEAFFAKEAEEFLKPGFLEEYKRRDKEYFEIWSALCTELGDYFTHSVGQTRERSVALVKKFFEYPFQDETCFYFGMSIWSFENKALSELEKRVKELYGKDFDAAWHIITSPTELSDEQKFRIELAELKHKHSADLSSADLTAIQQKYRYLGIYCPEDYGFDEDYVRRVYRDINVDETLGIPQSIEDNLRQLKTLLGECDDASIAETISLINFNVNFRNRRSEKLSYGFSLATPFYEFLMEKAELNRKQVGNVTRDEVIAFFEQDTFLPKRDQHPGMLYSGKASWVLGVEERDLFDKKFKQHTAVEEFTGKTAHPGNVRGTVKIIQSANELDKVKEGDVLVSQFTRPEFMAAIKKAVAIVTNDGGVTCHAAIVSRELNKPCIIGTKIATKVLHDGDEVEVDADKGIVKILKKA
jgi:phosphohistidine swiveling domain-containing protein